MNEGLVDEEDFVQLIPFSNQSQDLRMLIWFIVDMEVKWLIRFIVEVEVKWLIRFIMNIEVKWLIRFIVNMEVKMVDRFIVNMEVKWLIRFIVDVEVKWLIRFIVDMEVKWFDPVYYGCGGKIVNLFECVLSVEVIYLWIVDVKVIQNRGGYFRDLEGLHSTF